MLQYRDRAFAQMRALPYSSKRRAEGLIRNLENDPKFNAAALVTGTPDLYVYRIDTNWRVVIKDIPGGIMVVEFVNRAGNPSHG
jgi:hypothetical protein